MCKKCNDVPYYTKCECGAILVEYFDKYYNLYIKDLNKDTDIFDYIEVVVCKKNKDYIEFIDMAKNVVHSYTVVSVLNRYFNKLLSVFKKL
jgi:galactokinase/mevalonate kinase-like predicted kinase